MAKVVYASLKSSNTNRKSRSVTTKRVSDLDGKVTTVHTVNADSPTFGDDLSYVFRQKVRKARRESK